jgi:hypothetical protein
VNPAGPSVGRQRGRAVSSVVNQAKFIRSLLQPAATISTTTSSKPLTNLGKVIMKVWPVLIVVVYTEFLTPSGIDHLHTDQEPVNACRNNAKSGIPALLAYCIDKMAAEPGLL